MRVLGGVPPRSFLERYADSLRQSEDEWESFPVDYPMYTVPLQILLEMIALKSHEELLVSGELTIFEETKGKALFVSHEWVSKSHPDPEFKQFRVLQEALQNLTSGRTHASMDIVSEAVFGMSQAVTAEDLNSAPLFVWYDYFSCPQLHAQAANIDDRGSSLLHLHKAIGSIPAYISKCSFFVALCPVVQSPDSSRVVSHFSWTRRGWCRVEQAIRELSVRGGPWILVKSPMHQEVTTPLDVQPPGEGAFTVRHDRTMIGSVMKQVIRSKLLTHLKREDLVGYRVLLNQQRSRLRGLPCSSDEDLVPGFPSTDMTQHGLVLSKFMFHNGFKHYLERDAGGWSPLCYASMRGDPVLVQALLDQQADPNDKLKKAQPKLGLDKGCPVLALSTKFKNHDSMKVLIAAGARLVVPGCLMTGMSCACHVDDAEAIRYLCAAGSKPAETNNYGVSALRQACVTGSLNAMAVLLEQDPGLDLSLCLHWAAMGTCGSARSIEWLLQVGADLNEQYRPSILSPFGILWRMKGLQHKPKAGSTQLRRIGYHHYGATPLMIAILSGNFDAAAVLIDKSARLDIKNSRGKTALDMARKMSAPVYLLTALRGHEEIRSLVHESVALEDQAGDADGDTFSI